ncbi:unnamed protein product [marine sediment metagenome]|uniref:Uncharacterized protein n=1 Tax=marine sediment metagenome TaxID=412755 RepID=X1VCT4_9ZZZZ
MKGCQFQYCVGHHGRALTTPNKKEQPCNQLISLSDGYTVKVRVD